MLTRPGDQEGPFWLAKEKACCLTSPSHYTNQCEIHFCFLFEADVPHHSMEWFLLSISQYRKMPYIFDGTCNANVAHMCNILHVYSLFVIALFAYEAIVLNVYANSYQCLCSGRGKHMWCGMNALCGAINNECWFIAIPLYWHYISAYSNIWHIIKRPHRRNEIHFHSWPNA